MKSYNCGHIEIAAVSQNNIEKVLSDMPINTFTVAINAEKIIQLYENSSFRDITNSSYINFVDGVMAISLVKKYYKNIKLQKIDMPSEVINFAIKSDKTIGLIGSRLEIVTEAAQRLKQRGVAITKISHGFLSDENLIEILTQVDADYILLALGSPRQEYIAREATKIGCKTRIIPCGGAIDIISGTKKRAPRWVQKLRVEFLYRLLTEPSRMRRYIRIFGVFKYV